MPADAITGFRFFRTDDEKGAEVSAVYAVYGPAHPLGDESAPQGCHAVMWAAEHISHGELSEHFIIAFTREISVSRLYNIALPLYNYIQASKDRLLADIAS